jgi:hypothetical protein
MDPEDAPHQRLREAAGLLAQLLLQDIERQSDGPAIKEGVSRDRVVSVPDPAMRHGRENASKRFDGHKAGNAPDHHQALALVEQAEANTGAEVVETIGDCAYGDGQTRQAFAEAERRLVAKVPSRRGQAYFPKEAFTIDLETMTCMCPAGQECRQVVTLSSGDRYGAPGTPLRAFRFDGVCAACPLRPSVFGRDQGMGGG